MPVHPVFADPKTDFVFKRIFGSEARKPLLIALLNHLLELEGDRCVQDIQHLSSEQRVDVDELKLSIVDVKCTDATGRRFVVEMQVLKVEGFDKRVVYNASKAYVMQLRSADEYPALCDVVGVTICNFKLWAEKDKSGRFKVPMLSRWRMQEQHGKELGLPQIQYVFLELPKYGVGADPQTVVEKWAYFFREAKNLNVVPPALSEAPFRDALEVTRELSNGVRVDGADLPASEPRQKDEVECSPVVAARSHTESRRLRLEPDLGERTERSLRRDDERLALCRGTAQLGLLRQRLTLGRTGRDVSATTEHRVTARAVGARFSLRTGLDPGAIAR